MLYRTAVSLVVIAFFASPAALAEPVARGSLEPKDRVALLGDSITEQRNYSVAIENYLLMCRPQPDLQAAQFGWGGETTWGFKNRIQQDVLWFEPDVATICYGMNDGGYQSLDPQRLQEYTQSTRDIVRQLREADVRHIVLVGPGPVDTDTFRRDNITAEEYNRTLAAFNEAAGELAEELGLGFADLHTVMSEAMARFKEKHPGVPLAGGDGIHPDNNGHLVMAYAILKALGCDGDLGSVTVDLGAHNAVAEGGHEVLEFNDGTVMVESRRYPFCFANGPLDPRGQMAGLDAVPFNEELNRFTLIVKNSPAERIRVTWGGQTKEFTAEELAEGINLAAEFVVDNPFRQPFERVSRAVQAQQDFETPLTKQWLHGQPERRQQVPEAAEAWEEVIAKGLEIDRLLREAAASSVVPVRHDLRIEPVH